MASPVQSQFTSVVLVSYLVRAPHFILASIPVQMLYMVTPIIGLGVIFYVEIFKKKIYL